MREAIQAETLYYQISSDHSPQVIDIRSGTEFGKGHIPGALNIPYLRLHYKPGFVPDNQPVVIYGSNNNEKDQQAYVDALALLDEQNIKTTVLDGGFEAWQQAGFPIEYE